MTAARISDLETKLAARDGKPGYAKNCDELRAEIARLRRVQGAAGDSQESAPDVSP